MQLERLSRVDDPFDEAAIVADYDRRTRLPVRASGRLFQPEAIDETMDRTGKSVQRTVDREGPLVRNVVVRR